MNETIPSENKGLLDMLRSVIAQNTWVLKCDYNPSYVRIRAYFLNCTFIFNYPKEEKKYLIPNWYLCYIISWIREFVSGIREIIKETQSCRKKKEIRSVREEKEKKFL